MEEKFDINKTLTYVAFGFLLVLVSFNLNFPSFSINILPDWAGFILFLMAYDHSGTYVKGKEYLKWMLIALTVLSGTGWLMSILNIAQGTKIISVCQNTLYAIYLLILFGILEQIASDFHSSYAANIRILKYLNIGLTIAFVLFGILTVMNSSNSLAALTAVAGIAALVTAVITAVTLFKLREDVK